MNYYTEISKSFTKVWEDFYIDYLAMYKILEPAHEIYKKRKAKKLEKEIQSLNFSENVDNNALLNQNGEEEENAPELTKCTVKFLEQFKLEINKVDYFYNENINNVIKPKVKEVKEQIQHAQKINEFKMYSDVFELALKEIYKDIYLTKQFYEINMTIKLKLMQKYKKYYGIDDTLKQNNTPQQKEEKRKSKILIHFEEENEDEDEEFDYNAVDPNEDIEKIIDNYLEYNPKIRIQNNNKLLEELTREVIVLFNASFSYKYKSKTEKSLTTYALKTTFTESQSFYLGFFVGLLLFQLTIVCVIAYYYRIDMDVDVEFKSIFPMFRGFFIVCLYWWVHGVNIYVWMNYDISYRVIFHIDNNYSYPIQIFKRAAIFTFILLSCLLIYMIKRTWSGSFFGILDPIPINVLPLICWGSLIFYMFCPFEIWNYSGRAFLGDLSRESFGSFLLKTEFRHAFFVGQVCSFISTMRDLEYTVCYYAYYDAPLWAKKEYCNKTRGIYFFIAFFPNFIRILQNVKEIYDSGKYTPKIYSIFQYCLNISVALLSFFWPQYPSLHIVWLVATFISSCCSFTWDMLIDFGFFEKGSKNYPLRTKLYYKSKAFYYGVMVYDFILRFFWLLTISPEVLGSLVRPETLSVILNSLEMTRRGLWNIIKVENKHIDISKEFKVSNDIELPFVKVNGKYVNNESNLLNVMKMNRQEKIQVEIEKILQEQSKKSKYASKNLTDLGETKTKTNQDLMGYLDSYKLQTDENMGKVKSKVNYLSRKI